MANTRDCKTPDLWVREDVRLNRPILGSDPDRRSPLPNPGAAPPWSGRPTLTLVIVSLLTAALVFLLTLAIP
jgi:hypothetical protein